MGCPLPLELRKLMENRIFEPPLFYQALPRLHWQPDNTAGQTVSSDIFLREPDVTVNNNYMSCEDFHFHFSDFDPSVVHIPKPVVRSSSALNLFHIRAVDDNIKMSEETVCPSCTVQYKLKRTESSILRCTQKTYSHTDQYLLFDLITLWSTSRGSSEP